MKRIIHIVALLCTLIAFGAVPNVGCDQPPVTSPTGGFKCGPQAQQCPGGGCCSLSEDCGGIYPNCPAGMCCANDGDNGRVFGHKQAMHGDAGQ